MLRPLVREALLLVVIVGMAIGWTLDHARLNRLRDDDRLELLKARTFTTPQVAPIKAAAH